MFSAAFAFPGTVVWVGLELRTFTVITVVVGVGRVEIWDIFA